MDQSFLKEPTLYYDALVQTVSESIELPVDPCCNGFIAINKGAVLATVNQIPLKPFPPGFPDLSGESITVGGNRGELYRGRIVVQFAGAGGNVVIIQKYYKQST